MLFVKELPSPERAKYISDGLSHRKEKVKGGMKHKKLLIQTLNFILNS
jgi:hypothetical protein